mgnify:CR=1 FL=1
MERNLDQCNYWLPQRSTPEHAFPELLTILPLLCDPTQHHDEQV